MTIDLERGTTCDFDLGSMSFDGGNKLTVNSPEELVVSGLAESDWARVSILDSWICLMPERGDEVAVYDPRGGRLSVVGRIDRLHLGASDPGGMHVVNLYPISDDEVVIETELSVARVSRSSGLVWLTEHAEYTTWVVGLDQDNVVCENNDDPILYRLLDGMEVFSWETPDDDARAP